MGLLIRRLEYCKIHKVNAGPTPKPLCKCCCCAFWHSKASCSTARKPLHESESIHHAQLQQRCFFNFLFMKFLFQMLIRKWIRLIHIWPMPDASLCSWIAFLLSGQTSWSALEEWIIFCQKPEMLLSTHKFMDAKNCGFLNDTEDQIGCKQSQNTNHGGILKGSGVYNLSVLAIRRSPKENIGAAGYKPYKHIFRLFITRIFPQWQHWETHISYFGQTVSGRSPPPDPFLPVSRCCCSWKG